MEALTSFLQSPAGLLGLGFITGLVLMGLVFLFARQSWFAQIVTLKADIKAQRDAHDHAREALDSQFKLSAQDAVQKAHQFFLQLAGETFKKHQADGVHDFDKRSKAIDDMVKPVHQNLEMLSKALEQVKGTDQDLRQTLQSLNKETARLVGALRDPAAQGRWGEYILEGLLEKSGLIKGVHYETQVSMNTAEGRQRPDAVISMQDGFNIIVDAKAPLNEFAQRLGQETNEQDYKNLMQNLAKHVREHVKKLGQRNYWENIESPDFVVMFLPSEQMYSVALRADPSLVDYAAERGVIIASPTLLMSLLRVVGMSWKQVELAKNAQEISERGLDLYKRLLTFTGHIEKIGKNIDTAMRGYNDAVGSLQTSVLPAARKFKELQPAAGGKEYPDLGSIDQAARPLTLNSDDQDAIHDYQTEHANLKKLA